MEVLGKCSAPALPTIRGQKARLLFLQRQHLNWLYAESTTCRLGLNQRAAYQRIYLVAWLIVLVPVALFAWYVLTLDGTAAEQPNTPPAVRVLDIRPNGHVSPSQDIPAGRRNLPMFAQKHENFLGFVNPVIIRDNPSVVVDEPAAPSSDLVDTRDDAAYDPEMPTSFSPLEGANYVGVVIPENIEYFFTEDVKPKLNCSRLASVVRQPYPEFPLTEKMGDAREGFVSVLVCVGPDGKLMPFRVTDSGPLLPYWIEHQFVRSQASSPKAVAKFGKWHVPVPATDTTAFTKALLAELFPEGGLTKCVFQPEISEECVPVPGYLFIRYYFCLAWPMCREISVQEILNEVEPSKYGDASP